MENKETIVNDIQYIEKAIKGAEELRQEAITKKSMWEQSVKEKDEELAKLGTTAEKGRKEIEEIDAEIEEKIAKLKEIIPFNLLKNKGKI
ncbi:MAG: hypothetical protein K0R54_14 [Clostridiaceae bacterium]|jgi:phage shock protein A|nr:hypothetical protein [Clostridiaceae bacterium]